MIYLRSILYNVVLCLSLLVYAPLAVLSFPLPILVRSRFIALWARFQLWSLRHVCRLDYQIEGRGNLPPGPAIVFSKHQSAWETLAYQVILPPLTWVLKRELLWIPLFVWGLARLRPSDIKRGTGRRAVDQVVKQGTDRRAGGLWGLIFPEGTGLPPRTRRKYKQGGAILAAESGYPVVPIAHNAGSFWPRRGFVKRPGVIRVAIGPVIESRGRSAAEITKLSEDWIESTMKELES